MEKVVIHADLIEVTETEIRCCGGMDGFWHEWKINTEQAKAIIALLSAREDLQ